MTWGKRMRVAVDVARGLSFLHSLDANVIYRDLKASNILLDSVQFPSLKLLIDIKKPVALNHTTSFKVTHKPFR